MAPDDRLAWDDVKQVELRAVSRRHTGDTPVEEHLVGLALSGGGIRSATFGLGVLETLKDLGLLQCIDYLSTVSGGGYIGAWLSANCKRRAELRRQADGEDAPDWLDPAADWRPSVAHLRRYSNYLSPKVGFFSADMWSMGAIWIRNTLLVQLTVVLAIAAALLLPRPLFQLFTTWPSTGDLRWLSVVLFLLAVVGVASNQVRLNRAQRLGSLRSSNWFVSLGLTVVLLAAAVAIGRIWVFAPFSDEPMEWVAVPVSLLLLLAGFSAQSVVLRATSFFWPPDRAPEEINYTQGWVQGLVVVPMMATGFFLAAVLWQQSTSVVHPLALAQTFGDIFMVAWRYWPLPLSIAFASLWMFAFASLRRHTLWDLGVAIFAAAPAVVVLHALLSAIMLLLHGWVGRGGEGAWLAFVWAPALVLYAFALTINILIGMLGRQSSESVREWWSRLGAWLGIYGFAWMLVTLAGVYGPRLGLVLLDAGSWAGLSTTAGWIVTTAAGLLAGNSAATSGASDAGASQKTVGQRVMNAAAAVAPFVFIGGLLVGVSTALHLTILNNSVDSLPAMASLRADYWFYLNQSRPMVVLALLAGVTASLLILAGRVDINEFSLNAFYRSRLTRCYLGATRRPEERTPQNFTGFDEEDDLRLSDLASIGDEPAAGPLHLINCALNLGGSSDLALHTRRSASFTISPCAVGSAYVSHEPHGARPPIGFTRTSRYGGDDGQISVGQAISVSGAAASPNMGYHTSAVVAFLLTLFNVRLGWWFPSPRVATTSSASPWFSLRYLLMELFGGADDSSKFLMISDGGHFENLATYELVRRKCRVIIISDAECDPDLHFSGLGSLIRMCEVDFNVRIDLDVAAVRGRGQPSWSSRNFAVGRIVYGGGIPDGVLIYLKASMTGAEDSAVLQYKASHPAFPHESTGDQFYSEDQFESYRRLGREVATMAFGTAPPLTGGKTFVAMATEMSATARATRAVPA